MRFSEFKVGMTVEYQYEDSRWDGVHAVVTEVGILNRYGTPVIKFRHKNNNNVYYWNETELKILKPKRIMLKSYHPEWF